MNNLLNSLRNLTVGYQVSPSNIMPSVVKWNITHFHSSPVLSAEPLKKRKRVDPLVMKERGEKKIRRMQKEIRKLEKVAKKFKPISEIEVPRKIYRDSELKRSGAVLTEVEMIERIQLRHEWAIYKRREHVAEIYALQCVMNAQEKALDALQETSLELYEEALKPDPAFLPFKMKGPVETPPIENYDYPDGDYKDVTKEYMPIIPTDPRKQRKLGLLKKK